jgi:tetratricopeptide (TPR) repeat protein
MRKTRWITALTLLLSAHPGSMANAQSPGSPPAFNHTVQQCPLRFAAAAHPAAEIPALQGQLKILQRQKKTLPAGNALNQLGDQYRVLGDYGQARSAYEQSIALAKAGRSPGLEAASLAGLSHVDLELGQPDRAQTGFEKSFQLRKTLKAPFLEALALNNLGLVQAAQGQFPQAAQSYQQGLKLAPPQFRWLQLLLIGNQGNQQFFAQTPTAALNTYNLALQQPTVKTSGNYGPLMNNRGLAYQALGQTAPAWQAYDAALATFSPPNNVSCQWKTLSNRASLLVQQGRTAEAISEYRRAIAVTTLIWRRSGLSPADRQSYRAVILPVYAELAALLNQEGRSAEAEAVLGLLDSAG